MSYRGVCCSVQNGLLRRWANKLLSTLLQVAQDREPQLGRLVVFAKPSLGRVMLLANLLDAEDFVHEFAVEC